MNLKHCVEIGKGFWNIRASLKMALGLVDIGTHMSLCRLSTGKFLVIDTVELTQEIKSEIDQLTNNGALIEAVLATHPYHTLYFPGFHAHYPQLKYYGTPRHLRNFPSIPWAGDLTQPEWLNKWEPDVSMRIPDGASIDPNPENHFICIFVFHRESRTVHADDTIMYFENHPGFVMGTCLGIKPGTMDFHVSMRKDEGLNHTPEAPFEFKRWVEGIIRDWDFDNICTAHIGNKIGGAKQQLIETLARNEKVFQNLSEKHKH